MTTHAHFDELAAGYALGVLDPSDLEVFKTHLATCETCQATLADLDRVSTGIGLSVEPVAPPPALRARVLAQATRSDQERRVVEPARAPVGPRTAGWWRMAAAAGLVLAVGTGMYAWGLRQQLASARVVIADLTEREARVRGQLAAAREAAVTLASTLDVLRSPDVVRVDLRAADTTSPAAARAFVSAGRGVIFSADRLPSIGPNRTYQLWVIPAGPGAAPVSVGLFDIDATGTSAVSLALSSAVTSVAAVAVSEEPAGGSLAPTSAPLLVGTPVNN